MYVKVTAGSTHDTMLFEAESPVHSGCVAGEWVDSLIDFEKAIGHSATALHVLEFEPDQTAYEVSHNLASFRYAWWATRDQGTVCVVTTRNIFILNDHGDTIDKA